jgi:hypothetical protein
MTDAVHHTQTDAATPLPALQVGPLLATLERHGVAHVVIGGVAAQLHGATRPVSALDITANPYGSNLERLRAALVDLDAREYVPGFGYPLQLSMDRRRLSAEAPLHTVTRLGALDVIPRPHGLDGYRDVNHRARDRYAYGLMVPVADLEDLIHSHTAASRAKDGPIIGRLQELQARIRDHGIQPVFEQPSPNQPLSPNVTAPPTNERHHIHEALDAAAALAVVFDDIRPALAAARRQLHQALDDTDYGEGATVMRRVQVARNAVDSAHAELISLRRQLDPGVTDPQLAEPPLLRGKTDSPTLLAYQAYDETSVTRRLLADIDAQWLRTADTRDLLIEARIHAATADANLDLLQLQLERTARAWELPEHGHELPGPEL